LTESATLAPRPAASIVARVAGERLPTYVIREQARAIINAATTLQHRVLLECLWQSGGRVSEVVRLRPRDVDALEGALMLENRKQKRGNRRKRVYVSPDLVAPLQLLARERRTGYGGFLFGSAKSAGEGMSTVHAWRIVTDCSAAAGCTLKAPTARCAPQTDVTSDMGQLSTRCRKVCR
jgi:integrase